MCGTHHLGFNAYAYFIRYIPEVSAIFFLVISDIHSFIVHEQSGKFVLVNYSNRTSLASYHGKAIALDTGHRYSPFPTVFIIHEMRVRGRYPFASISPPIPSNPPFQDWIATSGVFNPTTMSFIRAKPRNNNNNNNNGGHNNNNNTVLQPMTGVSQSGLVLNGDVIHEIIQATREMDLWKACQIEGTDWSGTGEENIRKYILLSDP